jgi:hypothetical protein
MMKKIKLKGKTTVDKLKHIEKILQHFSTRLRKSVVIVIPPIPVGCFVRVPDVDGFLFAFPFSADGDVKNIYISAKVEGTAKEKKQTFSITIMHECKNDSIRATELNKSGKAICEMNASISAGDVLYFYTQPEFIENLKDITVGFNINVSKKDCDVSKQSIEALEIEANEGI